jgi:Domain of unknown function (DUF3784)
MWIQMVVQLFVIILFSFLGWAITVKKKYGLLSGFQGRSKEDQRRLIENGYPQKSGFLLILTALGMLILFPLVFTPFPYTIEVQFGFMILFFMGGFIYLSKYEVPEKKKKSYWFTSLLTFVVIGFISVIMYLGYQPNELIVKEATIEITGMYGQSWKISNVQKITLLEEMPEVLSKENGFGLATISKGHFNVRSYGSSLLFVHKQSPYILIEMNHKPIFINGENPDQTYDWYEQLLKQMDSYSL